MEQAHLLTVAWASRPSFFCFPFLRRDLRPRTLTESTRHSATSIGRTARAQGTFIRWAACTPRSFAPGPARAPRPKSCAAPGSPSPRTSTDGNAKRRRHAVLRAAVTCVCATAASMPQTVGVSELIARSVVHSFPVSLDSHGERSCAACRRRTARRSHHAAVLGEGDGRLLELVMKLRPMACLRVACETTNSISTPRSVQQRRAAVSYSRWGAPRYVPPSALWHPRFDRARPRARRACCAVVRAGVADRAVENRIALLVALLPRPAVAA